MTIALRWISSARLQSFSSRDCEGKAFWCGLPLSPFVTMTKLPSARKREIAFEKVVDSFMLFGLLRSIVILCELLNVNEDSHVNAMNDVVRPEMPVRGGPKAILIPGCSFQ